MVYNSHTDEKGSVTNFCEPMIVKFLGNQHAAVSKLKSKLVALQNTRVCMI